MINVERFLLNFASKMLTMSAAQAKSNRQTTVVEIILTCSVGHIPLSCLNSDYQDLHGDSDLGNAIMPKFWLAVPCACLSGADHTEDRGMHINELSQYVPLSLETKGVPFHSQGYLPEQACPRRKFDRGIKANKMLTFSMLS